MKHSHDIDYSEAKQIIDLIIQKATAMQKSIAVAVADSHGELIAFARMDGVALPSINIAINKAHSAARARKATQEIGDKVRHPEKGYDIAYYGDPKFVGWGGGVPVLKGADVIGAIAVSGLSAAEDADLAALGAKLLAPR